MIGYIEAGEYEWHRAYQSYINLVTQVDGIFSKIRENHFIVADCLKPVVDTLYWEHRPLLEFVLAAQVAHREQAKQAVDAAILGAALSGLLGLSLSQGRVITEAALLHDTGMLIIPQEILEKPKKLTKADAQYIFAHPGQSFRLINREFHCFEGVAQIAAERHEYYNGGGYPKGLAGRDIALEARIIAAGDTFAALISDRPYRRALNGYDAMIHLTGEAGAQLDPAVVQAFGALMGIYPIGSLVELNTGASARVLKYEKTSPLLKPWVRLVRGAPGEALKQGTVLDLAQEKNVQIKAPLGRQDILMDLIASSTYPPIG
ncbi:MAG: HD domain-containing protein [Spirochaetaceae bacterium]|jgi:HD-GYP domain-containing protein (c-di-GMP phosphodiesterase class II)|nr:HD domain-containing protein [Spirochaetaceae bacterium]